MDDKGSYCWLLVANSFFLDLGSVQVALFCLCMGCIMYFHEYEPDTMAPFLRGLLTRFLNRTGTPAMHSSTSYSYLPALASSDDRLSPPSASTSQSGHNVRGSAPSSRSPGSPSVDGGSQGSRDSLKTPERLTIEAFQGLWAFSEEKVIGMEGPGKLNWFN